MLNDIQEIREELLQSVSGLTDEQLNEKQESKWSIMQVLEHLYLTENLIVHKMKVVMASDEETNVENKSFRQATNRSHKFTAPPSMTPSNEFSTFATIQEKLLASRTSLKEFLVNAEEEKMLKRSLPHPVFGSLNVKQWVEFIGLHEKRHLAQIEEIKQELRLIDC
ncbi:DinB family protein [Bacillus sp. S13(2024)]|uniref:DinB family protein n=1 Tax=unclassified Bacillus (in: firmicutes) TaxID=185979 RepID=UPI003D22615E